jgi:hypothetical protein
VLATLLAVRSGGTPGQEWSYQACSLCVQVSSPTYRRYAEAVEEIAGYVAGVTFILGIRQKPTELLGLDKAAGEGGYDFVLSASPGCRPVPAPLSSHQAATRGRQLCGVVGDRQGEGRVLVWFVAGGSGYPVPLARVPSAALVG